jgi:Tfp pilus assembly protein PilX
MNRNRNRAAGFTLVTTLFLLVIVAGLAAYLVNLSVAQHHTSALSVDTLRGRHAAVSGLEWVAYHIANVTNSCPTVPTVLAVEGFDVTLSSCSVSDVTEGAVSYRLFNVVVSAQRGSFGDADYVNLAIRANLRG